MQLPRELQHFPEPALLVLADSQRAQFWLAHGDQFNELERFSLLPELKSDREASFINTDHGGSRSGPEPHHDDRFSHFCKMIAEKTSTLVRDGQADVFHLVMPLEVANEVKKHLADDVAAKLGKTVDLDLMKDSPLEAVKRVIPKIP